MDKKVWLHITLKDGCDASAFAELKDINEVRDYFANYVGALPYRGFPDSAKSIYVIYTNNEWDRSEVWQWSEDRAMVDVNDAYEEGRGFRVEVDGEEVFSNWVELP